MALVEVARFLDATEAQVAASALRASGIPVFVQNEQWGQVETYMQLAVGGFALWTPEDMAQDASDFIAECRSTPSEATVTGGPVQTAAALVLAFLLTPTLAWIVPLFRRRSRAPISEPNPIST